MSYTPVYPLYIMEAMSNSDSYVLVLQAPEVGKEVPLIIGSAEAQAIVLAINNHPAIRPLTHNLICSILDEYQISLKRVTIDRFDEGVFFSSLYLSDGFSEKKIDSRTTDALVLALLRHCSVSMNMQVLEETSMEHGALENNLPHSYNSSHYSVANVNDLEEQLRRCEELEDYEQAAEIMKQINRLKGEENAPGPHDE